jgi:hypothetical protein
MPGGLASMPNRAEPFVFSGVSRRLTDVPMILNALAGRRNVLGGAHGRRIGG